MIICSAPGKLILFGEHAVVYGRPALAVPITEVKATAEVSALYGTRVKVSAPDIGLEADLSSLLPGDPIAAAFQCVLEALKINSPPPLSLRVTSTIPVAAGLGSGAAVSVAVIRALSTFLGTPLSDERVSALAFEVEKLHHGTPSGIDNTVITWSRPVFFIRDQPMVHFQPGGPFTLVIGDTGLPAPTRESVADVRRLWEADPSRWERVFDKIAFISDTARDKIEKGEWWSLGVLLDANHALLQELTVSSPELDGLVQAARQAGALGAKMSGGGRGGTMFALVERAGAQVVARALEAAGAARTIITTIS